MKRSLRNQPLKASEKLVSLNSQRLPRSKRRPISGRQEELKPTRCLAAYLSRASALTGAGGWVQGKQVSGLIRLCATLLLAAAFLVLSAQVLAAPPSNPLPPKSLVGSAPGASTSGSGNSQAAPIGSAAAAAAAKANELALQASSREIEKQIVDKILGEGYDKRIRPAGSGPYNASRPGK